jgi:hypothetical protein
MHTFAALDSQRRKSCSDSWPQVGRKWALSVPFCGAPPCSTCSDAVAGIGTIRTREAGSSVDEAAVDYFCNPVSAPGLTRASRSIMH